MPSAVERFESVTAVLAGSVTGGVVGVVGSVFHRVTAGSVPVGVVGALAAVALGAVFVRALAGRGTFAAYAVTVLGAIALAIVTDDLIVVPEGAGLVWGIGAAALLAAGALLPERWFTGD